MDGHKGQVVGYVRVSAADQKEARQLEALGAVDRLFCEKVSGKNTNDRAQLREMLIYVRDGDTVRVKSPDRLGGWCFSFGGVAVPWFACCVWENWGGWIPRDSGVIDDVRSGAYTR